MYGEVFSHLPYGCLIGQSSRVTGCCFNEGKFDEVLFRVSRKGYLQTVISLTGPIFPLGKYAAASRNFYESLSSS